MWGMIIFLGVMLILFMFGLFYLYDEIDKLRKDVNKQEFEIHSTQFDLDLMKKKLSHQSYLDRRI